MVMKIKKKRTQAIATSPQKDRHKPLGPKTAQPPKEGMHVAVKTIQKNLTRITNALPMYQPCRLYFSKSSNQLSLFSAMWEVRQPRDMSRSYSYTIPHKTSDRASPPTRPVDLKRNSTHMPRLARHYTITALCNPARVTCCNGWRVIHRVGAH